MSLPPLHLIGLQRAIRISAEIEAQLSGKFGTSPVLAILVRAREEAAQAMSELVLADASNPEAVRTAQHKVLRFDDLVRWLSRLVADGFEAEREIADSERDELADLLTQYPGMLDPEEAHEAGLNERNLNDA